MKTIRSVLFGVSVLFSFAFAADALALPQRDAPAAFDCVIFHDFIGGEFGYWVVDGFDEAYGPYDFDFDAMEAAQELQFQGSCDRIIDRSF